MLKINNEIIIFENQEIKLEVNFKNETVWLNQLQMSKLFKRDTAVISRHIKNIFEEELDKKSNLQKMQIANSDKLVTFYSLDVIISVGYRVKSKNGIIFRKWATKVLKDYLLKGYALNIERIKHLENTVKLINIAGRNNELNETEAKDIINIINKYSSALKLLDEYDNKSIVIPKGNITTKQISYNKCKNIIKNLKFHNKSKLFALERKDGLKEIINTIYQTYDGKDLYPTIEEKAANFLYLIIKNHIFIDGNKRIGATLFIYFLNFYNILYIDSNTLVSITLLIAQSDPKEKEVLISLILNFLQQKN